MTMRFAPSVREFHTHKGGGRKEDYEDAHAVGTVRDSRSGAPFARTLRVAVADGASESVLAGRWARRLADAFAHAASGTTLGEVLIEEVDAWPALVARYCTEREAEGKPIQWYEESGLSRGAYAACIGIEIQLDEEGEGALAMWCLGDSCMFHIRNDILLQVFPPLCSKDFHSSPALAPSKPSHFDAVLDRIQTSTTRWMSGDNIYLATDAMSFWFLGNHETGGKPWWPLKRLESEADDDAFVELVRESRESRLMPNDDATVLIISL